MEVSRVLPCQFLLRSVEGADGHEPKTATVCSGSCVDLVIGRDDRLWCSFLKDDQLGDALDIKGETVSDEVIDGR